MFRFVLSVLFMLSAQAASALSYTMEFTEAEIQQRLSASMPRSYTKSLTTVKLLDPQVRLVKETDELAISSPLDVAVSGRAAASGYINLKGALSYDATKGAFFLMNPTVTEISFNGMPEVLQPVARAAAQGAVRKSLATRPIYTLRDDNWKHKLAKATIQSVTVKDQKVRVVLSL